MIITDNENTVVAHANIVLILCAGIDYMSTNLYWRRRKCFFSRSDFFSSTIYDNCRHSKLGY